MSEELNTIGYEDFVKRLEVFGYEMKFEDSGVEHWSKQTSLAVPVDKTSKEKPYVHLEYDTLKNTVSLHLDAYNGLGWVTVSITDIETTKAYPRLKSLEEQVCFGYREAYQ